MDTRTAGEVREQELSLRVKAVRQQLAAFESPNGPKHRDTRILSDALEEAADLRASFGESPDIVRLHNLILIHKEREKNRMSEMIPSPSVEYIDILKRHGDEFLRQLIILELFFNYEGETLADIFGDQFMQTLDEFERHLVRNR